MAQEFAVQAMPTFVLLKQGKEVERVVGAKKDDLEKMVVKHRETPKFAAWYTYKIWIHLYIMQLEQKTIVITVLETFIVEIKVCFVYNSGMFMNWGFTLFSYCLLVDLF